MKLIRTIKNTVIDGIINEGKIPNGVKRRLRKMDPKEVVQELKSRSLNRIKISETLKKVKTSNSDVVKDIVKDICDDVAMLYVPYYDEYDEYARNDTNWDGSDDEYDKIVKIISHQLFFEYGDEVIDWVNREMKKRLMRKNVRSSYEIPEQMSPELAQDLEAFHNIKINEMINESKGISEPIRYVVRDITDIIKSETPGEYYLPEDTTETNEIEYDFKKDFQKFGISRSYNIPSFSIELLYKISDEKDMDVPYMINGALMSDGDTISIVIIINPEEYPSLMYNLVADINDIVAHEIEHIFQQNNMRPEGEIYDDGEDKIQPKDKEYYKQPHELPAQLKGFKRVSKLRKQPIEKVIKDWFNRSKYAHQLSDEDSSEVISYLVNYYNNEFKPKMVKENKRPSDYLRRRVGHLITDKSFNRLKRSCINMLERARRAHPTNKEKAVMTAVRLAIEEQSYEWYGNHLGFDDEDDKLFDEIYSLMWNTYSKDLIEYIFTNMEYVKSVMDYVSEDNPETIKESELPPSVRRRVNISYDFGDDILDDIKAGSLRMLMLKVSEFDQIINKGFKWAAEEMVPYDEDYDEDYDEYIEGVVLLLKDKYEDDVIEYVTRVIGTFNGPDTHKYTFKKHSKRHGGSGFSETFNTWDDLILRFGYWMPLEWDEIKRKLDDKNEGQILISSPGEPTNTMNYYFSIQKKPKNSDLSPSRYAPYSSFTI